MKAKLSLDSCIKENVCLITHHPFWAEPLGCGTLISARYDLLKKFCQNVYVLYITSANAPMPHAPRPMPGGSLNVSGAFKAEHISAIKEFLKNYNISTCYFSYDHYGFLTEFTECKNVVEIHDVMHLREAQFNKFGYDAPSKANKADEIKSLQRYDYVLSLNLNEVEYLRKNGITNARYLPPNLPFNNEYTSSDYDSFGLIGSMAKPNLDGFQSLNIALTRSDKFVLAGPISINNDVVSNLGGSVNKLGIVESPSSFYSVVGVALSPVRFGGGLKIKVFEALSFGKPVLATQHSIDGFPQNIEDVVTVVDDITSWNLDTIKTASEIPSSLIKDFFVSSFSEQHCVDIFREVL
jgi:glycosyltransferase involved in cell wall biosynthesis